MNETNRRRTKQLAVSAMLCAIGVILMMLGATVQVLDLSVAALASLLCIYAVIELGGAYPWLIWLVTSILSLLLLPQKTPAVFYALFLGYYPILKSIFEKLPRTVTLLCKLLTFHAALAVIYLTLRLFFPDTLETVGTNWFLAVIYLLALACFLVYDFALTRLISTYLFRFRKRFRIK